MPLENNNIVVRPAIAADCPRMMELVHELAVFERAPHEVTVTMEHFIESGFGKNPVWWAFVAEADGVIVAFALYYIRYSTWKGQRMYLEDILVTEEWRRRGVGTLLMNALLERAQQLNLHGISWQVLDWNESAIKFYENYQVSFDPEWVNVMLTFNKENIPLSASSDIYTSSAEKTS